MQKKKLNPNLTIEKDGLWKFPEFLIGSSSSSKKMIEKNVTNLKILLYSANFKEKTWIRIRIHYFPVRIQDPEWKLNGSLALVL